jgi:hypothetical protein
VRVSVLIPSYNHERFLGECLQAALGQSYADFEIVLVDDCSADGSVALAQGFAADPRLKVLVNEANLGTYGTLARGLENSTGELVAVLNSDDLWLPGKLEKQVAALMRHPNATACYTLGWTCDEQGRPDEGADPHDGWSTEPVQDLLPSLVAENRVLASSVLFRRERLRFETNARFSGDWIALLEAASRGPMCLVPEHLTLWRQHGSNTYRISPGQVAEEIALRLMIARQKGSALGPGLAQNALHLSALAVLTGRKRLAVASAMEAVRLGAGLAALKRLVAALGPLKLSRKRMWGHAQRTDEVASERTPLPEGIALHMGLSSRR